MTAGIPRSNRPSVRNPVLALPSIAKLKRMPAPLRAAFSDLLTELAADASCRADKCWRRHKAPMAAYWKTVAVYARHTGRALRGKS